MITDLSFKSFLKQQWQDVHYFLLFHYDFFFFNILANHKFVNFRQNKQTEDVILSFHKFFFHFYNFAHLGTS